MRDGFVNLQNVQGLFFGYEIVHANDDFSFLSTASVAVGGFSDFALRIAAFDWRRPCAHACDAIDVFPCAALNFVGESFDEVGAAEGSTV